MSRMTIARLPDGRLEFWAVTPGGGLNTSWKLTTHPDADWSTWIDFLSEVGPLPAPVAAIAVAPLMDGRLELWAATSDGRLFSTWKLTTDSNGDWSGWNDFLAEVGPLPDGVASLSVAALPDGRLEVWAVTHGGGLFATWQTEVHPDSEWEGWFDFLGYRRLAHPVRDVAMGRLPDGRIEAWAVTREGGLYSTWMQDRDPNAEWTEWFDFLAYRALPTGVQQVCLAPLMDGRLEAWAVTTNGGLYSTWKVDADPDAEWSEWVDFFNEAGALREVTDIAVGSLPDRRLEIWARQQNGDILTSWQLAADANSDWARWSDFLAEVLATVDAVFLGTAVLSTNHPNIRAPITNTISLPITFSANGGARLTSFPPLVAGPFMVGGGATNTTTVTLKSGGNGAFDKSRGSLSMPVTLRFDHSHPFAAGSDAPMTLTTGSSTSPSGTFSPNGIPLDRNTGMVTAVAGFRFRGGFLNGTDGMLVIAGTLAPLP